MKNINIQPLLWDVECKLDETCQQVELIRYTYTTRKLYTEILHASYIKYNIKL